MSASQEIPHILWNSNVHDRIHNSPPPVPVLSHINPVNVSLPFLNIHFVLSSHLLLGLSLRCPHQKPVCTSPLHLTRYLPHPPFSSWFVRSNNIWSAVHMIKFIMSFYPLPCYLVPIRFKYFPQHPHFKHSQPMFVPLCERSSFLPIQNNRQNYSSVYFNLYIFGLQTGRW